MKHGIAIFVVLLFTSLLLVACNPPTTTPATDPTEPVVEPEPSPLPEEPTAYPPPEDFVRPTDSSEPYPPPSSDSVFVEITVK